MKTTYTTRLWIRHSFSFMNYWLIFSKEIELPFVPFIGLKIWDGPIEKFSSISLNNDNNTSTEITWFNDGNYFMVNIELNIRNPMADYHITGIMERFIANGWSREDKENTEELINSMAEHYKIHNG